MKFHGEHGKLWHRRMGQSERTVVEKWKWMVTEIRWARIVMMAMWTRMVTIMGTRTVTIIMCTRTEMYGKGIFNSVSKR